jgi:hypothetical protein
MFDFALHFYPPHFIGVTEPATCTVKLDHVITEVRIEDVSVFPSQQQQVSIGSNLPKQEVSQSRCFLEYNRSQIYKSLLKRTYTKAG